jgi:hypothetical protein
VLRAIAFVVVIRTPELGQGRSSGSPTGAEVLLDHRAQDCSVRVADLRALVREVPNLATLVTRDIGSRVWLRATGRRARATLSLSSVAHRAERHAWDAVRRDSRVLVSHVMQHQFVSSSESVRVGVMTLVEVVGEFLDQPSILVMVALQQEQCALKATPRSCTCDLELPGTGLSGRSHTIPDQLVLDHSVVYAKFATSRIQHVELRPELLEVVRVRHVWSLRYDGGLNDVDQSHRAVLLRIVVEHHCLDKR